MEYSIIEYVVSQLLSTAVDKWKQRATRISEDFDFVLEEDGGRKIAIEVVSRPPRERKISQLSEMLAAREEYDEFVLVTPDSPTDEQTAIFSKVLQGSKTPVKWIGINDLAPLLGIESPGDLTKPAGAEALKLAALVSNQQHYSTAPIWTGPATEEPKKEDIPPEFFALTRQFAFSQLSTLYNGQRPVRDLLGIGTRQENVTVVLSDLKNFSSLVKVSRPDDLNDLMGKYYFGARKLVWQHNGVLDKFIGDAVLAIFGYPNCKHSGAIDAIKFATELVSLGRDLLDGLSREINEDIPTGTRIGIETGDLWPLDIGSDHLEVSFVGNTLNLVARIEKNASTDKILISNRTRTRAISENGDFYDALQIAERKLETKDAKGQLFPIKCWEIEPK